MKTGMQRMAALAGCLLVASPLAHAQQQALPFQVLNPDKPVPGITTPQGRAENDQMMTTKHAPLPWQAADPTSGVTVTAPGKQAVPAAIPFGRATASQYQPIQESPHTAVAVPVENVDMGVQSNDLAPPAPPPVGADPANENPAEPTELTAPIFAKQDPEIPLAAEVQVLNKVTARSEMVSIHPGATAKVGLLTIKVSHCQRSVETSLPDAAALFEISQDEPDEKEPKPVFTGWMYQSSPSISALESPVYDVTLVGCKDLLEKRKPAEKDKKSSKK